MFATSLKVVLRFPPDEVIKCHAVVCCKPGGGTEAEVDAAQPRSAAGCATARASLLEAGQPQPQQKVKRTSLRGGILGHVIGRVRTAGKHGGAPASEHRSL